MGRGDRGEHIWGHVVKKAVCDWWGGGGARPWCGVSETGGQGHGIEWRAGGCLGRRLEIVPKKTGAPQAPERFSRWADKADRWERGHG